MTSKLLSIVGPTSTGKTSLALELARSMEGVIISADSRQIYKYMDIGTGKVPLNSLGTITRSTDFWVLDDIPIYGYDLVTPGEYFSVYDYVLYARNLINELCKKTRAILLVGGTGFYIDAVLGKIPLEGGGPDLKLRASLDKLSLEELLEKLEEASPGMASSIDKQNRVRVQRALEKKLPSKSLHKPLPDLIVSGGAIHSVGLTASRSYLYSRVDAWVDSIWDKLLLETTNLINAGYSDTPQMKGLIYKTSVQLISGSLTEAEGRQIIKYDLHAYIRRQQTWFKKSNIEKWHNIEDMSTDQIKSHLLEYFSV